MTPQTHPKADEEGCLYVDGHLDLTHAPSLGAFIGKSLASFVSGNRMPEISGDNRKRIPEHIRRRYDPACERIASDIIAYRVFRPAPASPDEVGLLRERVRELEAAYREGYDAGTCDGQALDAINNPDAAWLSSETRAVLTKDHS